MVLRLVEKYRRAAGNISTFFVSVLFFGLVTAVAALSVNAARNSQLPTIHLSAFPGYITWPNVGAAASVLIGVAFAILAARELVAGTILRTDPYGRLARSSIRILAALPTAVLAHVVILLFSAASGDLTAGGYRVLITLAAITAIAMAPTATQILSTAAESTSTAPAESGLALGMEAGFVGRRIVIPTLRGAIRTAAVLSIVRLTIETTVLLHTAELSEMRLARGSSLDLGEVGSVVEALYSASTIANNAWLIVLLFVTAIAFNAWSASTNPQTSP